MFQYAFGRYLSVVHNTTLKLDTSGFRDYNWRYFELSAFRADIVEATDEEIKLFTTRSYLSFLNDNVVLNEQNMLFDSKNLRTSENTYLSGYWQSEKYFQSIRNILLHDFKLKSTSNEYFNNMSEQILASPNSVSVHIRRGDYHNNPEVNKIHGVLGTEYYINSITYFKNSLENPVFYFFSDDIVWVKNEFNNFINAFFIEHNSEDSSSQEMSLMAMCRHNIIANSTFSWWGAWLNENPNKVVIAPKQWFSDIGKNKESRDIVPESWLKL